MNKADKNIRMLIRQKRDTEKSITKQITDEQRKEQVKKWTTFYRRNWDIYAEERLRIRLRPFQRVMLYMIGISNVWFGVCSRGTSKTFIVGLAAVIKCLLYPYSEVVLTAVTIDQAGKMVDEKIKRELIDKLSPVLKYMYDRGDIIISSSKDRITIDFFNGSKLFVAPPVDSSRGLRSCFTIFEECRLLKKGDVDSIFGPMPRPRQAVFLQKDEYSQDKDYLEEHISIYITSARYKNEWWYRLFKKVVEESFTDTKVMYNFFAADIFNSLKYGLKTEADWSRAKKTTSEIDIRMEYLNEALGEIEDAYFQLELMKKCQKLHQAFRPINDTDIAIGKTFTNREKKDNEIRILAIDFAFTNTTNNSQANDNTVIECISGFYNKGEIVRNLDYLETHEGGESELTQRRIRELFQDYQADYIVMDEKSGGSIHYNNLTKEYKHPARSSKDWDERGLCVCLDIHKQFVPEAKVNDLYNRRIDPNAKQIIIPVQGSTDFNDLMWRSLRMNMVDNKVRLLIDDLEFDTELSERKDYFQMSSEDKMIEKLPYVQTEFLVNEAINLKQELREGKIKLKEPRSSTKDRIVTLAYGNLFFDKLENIMSKEDQRDDFNEDDWSNIIII